MKHYLTILLALAIAVSLAGCGAEPAAPEPNSQTSIQLATNDPSSPQDVLERIYEGVQMNGLTDAGDEVLSTLFHMDTDLFTDYAIRYTDGRYGVCDVAIIKVAEGSADLVMDSLEMRRDDRIAEFENYDVFNSLEIAKNAEIFTRGNYVIMLMLEDTEAARQIILEEIPG